MAALLDNDPAPLWDKCCADVSVKGNAGLMGNTRHNVDIHLKMGSTESVASSAKSNEGAGAWQQSELANTT